MKTPMYLDLFLIAVMLISGLLAMVRGLIREVLSIAGWGAAAVAGLYAYSKLLPMTKQYISNDYMAAGVTVRRCCRVTTLNCKDEQELVHAGQLISQQAPK